jgi:membrane protein YdbS with pleckstrin-like domain
MVFGLLLILFVGLLDLASKVMRVRAVLFGIGAALVLDEFALILNLADVYWAPQGRESIDAVVIFAAVLVVVALGGNFWRAAWHELVQGERALARRS